MTSAKQWSARVSLWRRSGKSVAEFAASEGCNARTLAWWGWKLGAKKQPPSESVAFVRLMARGAASKPTLELTIGEHVHLRVERGFDAELLRAVVAALEPK
jgi:hypothetical protein